MLIHFIIFLFNACLLSPIFFSRRLLPSSDYTVNAMDVEELRRSQRRMKKPRSGGSELGLGYNLNPPSSTVSVSGSQDSEEDDDEVSTPSGELTERNLLSLLSVRYSLS